MDDNDNEPPPGEVNEENDWSGYATFISRSSSSTSSNAEYVQTESSSFTEYKMEAVLSRGLGTGGSSLVRNSMYRHTSKIDGKVSENIVSGNAHGSMRTDIDVSINSYDKEYSFFIPIPACFGEQINSHADGSSNVSEIAEGEAMIQVEFQPMGDNPNVLTGEIKEQNVGPNGEISETILRWSFVKGPLDVELIVTPQDYESWLPEPGKTENVAGSQMTVGLKLQGKDGKEPKLKARTFELQLANTSTEPGIAINYPVVADNEKKPDLRFLGNNTTQEGQQLVITPADGQTAVASIGAYDGGGYTTLRVEAVLEGGIRILGTLNAANGETDIDIPKRKKGSKIAEVWLKQYGDLAENFDRESSNGNNNDGDGLTAYEEYRGVFSAGQFRRLDPTKKELGVRISKSLESNFNPGLDLFSNASGVALIKLYDNELGSDRIINKNRGVNHGIIQHALLLENAKLDTGIVGRNEPETENGKTPKQSVRTVVDLNQIAELYAAQEAEVAKKGEAMPYTLEDEVANTIAHELAHGVFVTHHGPNSVVIPRTAERNHKPPYKLYDSRGNEMEIPKEGKAMKNVGDNQGNESSGDLNCIIAYTSRYQWYFEQDPDRTLVYRAVPLLAPGKIFCISGDPTGININGFFGPSHKGNCLGQIRIKDV